MPYRAALDWLNFFLADVRGGLGPYVSVFLLTEAQWNQAQIGAVLTVSGLIGISLHIPIGAFIDATRCKRGLLVAGVGVLAAGAVAIERMPTWPVVLAADILMAVLGAVFAPTVAAMTLGLVDPHSLPERFGRNAAFDRAGNLFIAGLVGLVGWRFSQHAVFYLVPLFAAVTSLIVLSIPRHAIDHERAHGGLSGSKATYVHPSGWGVLAPCKPLLVRGGDRVLVLLSSGDLAGTQAVISVLKQRGDTAGAALNLWNARTMFDVANLVADAMRDIERRDGPYLAESDIRFNASFILGGQISGEPSRLFRIYAEGNFIEAGLDTPFFQTGETKYGKPILDRVITRSTALADAAKCVLVSFDSTMRSNLSVGMPIYLICYQRDSLEIQMRRRFDEGIAYFSELSRQWSEGVRHVFGELVD